MSEEAFYAAVKKEETVTLEYFRAYMDCVRRNWDEITGFKEAYQNDDRDMANVHLGDMSEEDQMLLWRATTKGSVYSTEERHWLKHRKEDE